MTRPCKLQINQRGAWRDVIPFDMDEVDVSTLTVAAARLVSIADPSDRTTLRIVTSACSQPLSLFHWDAKKGWTGR